MRRLAVGSLVLSCIIVVACQQPNAPPPNQPPPYPQPGYGPPPAGYTAPPGQPGQPGYPPPGQPAPYGQPQSAQPPYGQPPMQPMPGAPPGPMPGAPPGPGPAAGGTMAVPGAAAFPCANDAACGLAHCNTQYQKCAFPCVDANVDCIQGAMCVAGFCVPKLPGT